MFKLSYRISCSRPNRENVGLPRSNGRGILNMVMAHDKYYYYNLSNTL